MDKLTVVKMITVKIATNIQTPVSKVLKHKTTVINLIRGSEATLPVFSTSDKKRTFQKIFNILLTSRIFSISSYLLSNIY